MKEQQVIELIKSMGRVAVAYSGGADSAYLAFLAHKALGENALAITALFPAFPPAERDVARKTAAYIGIRQIEVDVSLAVADVFDKNPPDRCYHCKKALVGVLLEKARAYGVALIEGSNYSDALAADRPGAKALAEYGVKSPLQMAGLTKDEIRTLSKAARLPTWDKPAAPCLATRIPYGMSATAALMEKADAAERALREAGCRVVRVRMSNPLRVELGADDLTCFDREAVRCALGMAGLAQDFELVQYGGAS